MSQLFDRHQAPRWHERVILVHVKLGPNQTYFQAQELVELSRTSQAMIVAQLRFNRNQPEPHYFIGLGQAQKLKQWVKQHQAGLIIFGHPLSPSQERNLSQLSECRVIDRIRLILDIFALRAHSHEGRLQVELAQLNYLSTRLVRGWTHLERQRGGIGLRGPGEKQLEIDRRLLAKRIESLKKQLQKVQGQRQLGRRTRHQKRLPCLALVGYTNAGKSTLFNALCQSQVYATDLLFATLDTTIRRVHLEGLGDALVIDTVGFIQQLPLELIAAFRATLEEVTNADLLLHVIDSSDPQRDANIQAVQQTIEEIGASQLPCIPVMNKIDQLNQQQKQHLYQQGFECQVSATTEQGFDSLLQHIANKLSGQHRLYELTLNNHYAPLRSHLHQLGRIVKESFNEQGQAIITVHFSQSIYQKIKRNPLVLRAKPL